MFRYPANPAVVSYSAIMFSHLSTGEERRGGGKRGKEKESTFYACPPLISIAKEVNCKECLLREGVREWIKGKTLRICIKRKTTGMRYKE